MVLADQNGESVVESELGERQSGCGCAVSAVIAETAGISRQKTIRNRTVLSMTVIACHLP